MVPLEIELSDDLVAVRPFETSDRGTLVRERDSEFRRFIGEGSPEPAPAACICISGRIVGWIDYDDQRDWLGDHEVNVGYNVFVDDRGRGYATRALRLLTGFLQDLVPPIRPTLLIDPANTPSLAVAVRAGFQQSTDIDGQRLFRPGPHARDRQY